MLQNLVALKGGAGDEQGILQINLILLVVVFVGKFAEAVNREVSGLVGEIGDLRPPNLIGAVHGNVIGYLRLDVGVFRGDNGVSRAVAALVFVRIQRLAHRLPCCRPVVA